MRLPNNLLVSVCLASAFSACLALPASGVAATDGTSATSATSATTSPPSGVHLDPNSPGAKEYAFPLYAMAGVGTVAPQSGAPQPSAVRFGAGITRSHAGATPSGARSHPTARAGSSGSGPSNTSTSSGSPAAQGTNPAPAPGAQVQGRREHVTIVKLPPLHRRRAGGRKPERVVPAAYRMQAAGGTAGLMWMALAAVLVVGVGSAGGFVLSRRR